MKTCATCKQEKLLEAFGKDSNKIDGLKYSCKDCRNKKSNDYRSADPSVYRAANLAYARSERGKYLQRANSLRRKFWPHLTSDQAVIEYDRLLAAQNFSCALCGEHKSKFRMSLAVDHCHETKVVRGLLCNKCNRFEVGRHTLATAEMLVTYLKKAA